MKFMMVLGGLLGFVVSLSLGLSREGNWPAMLSRACVVALLGGWLFRWWSRIWLRSLQECNLQRREEARLEARRKASEKSQSAPAPVSTPTHQP